MFEQIILGIIQGITEWLPVSSEGFIILAKTNLFHSAGTIEEAIRQALFLHFGTFLAALIYFRRDVKELIETISSYKSQPKETQKLFSFLLIATMISGAVGFPLIKTLSSIATQMESQGKIITLMIGCLLLGTAFLELKAKKNGYRGLCDLKISDGILLGIVQGLAALPGLSRSGLTVSTLLLRKLDKTYALKLSFLMSLPAVLAGNLMLNFNTLAWSVETLAGLTFSFIFGFASIHLLLKIAEKVNFGYFVLLFGVLTILSAIF
jgi:undecaprenyl-diphosphatase